MKINIGSYKITFGKYDYNIFIKITAFAIVLIIGDLLLFGDGLG